jgi:hypothetical protein
MANECESQPKQKIEERHADMGNSGLARLRMGASLGRELIA